MTVTVLAFAVTVTVPAAAEEDWRLLRTFVSKIFAQGNAKACKAKTKKVRSTLNLAMVADKESTNDSNEWIAAGIADQQNETLHCAACQVYELPWRTRFALFSDMYDATTYISDVKMCQDDAVWIFSCQ